MAATHDIGWCRSKAFIQGQRGTQQWTGQQLVIMIAYGGVPVPMKMANGSGDLQSCNFVIWEFLRRHYAGHTAIPAWHNNSEAPGKVMQSRCHEQRSPSKADASSSPTWRGCTCP